MLQRYVAKNQPTSQPKSTIVYTLVSFLVSCRHGDQTTVSGCFLFCSYCELHILTRSHLQLCSAQIETVFLCRQVGLIVRANTRAAPKPSAVLVVWRCEETHWVRCAARWTQASEPTLSAFCRAAKRRAECARVNLSSSLVPVLW